MRKTFGKCWTLFLGTGAAAISLNAAALKGGVKAAHVQQEKVYRLLGGEPRLESLHLHKSITYKV